MVAVDAPIGPAFLTFFRLRDTTVPDRVSKDNMGSALVGVALNPCRLRPRTSRPAFFGLGICFTGCDAIGEFVPLLVTQTVSLDIVFTVLLHIVPGACLALVEPSVGHFGLTVEFGKQLCFAALETLFFHAPGYMSGSKSGQEYTILKRDIIIEVVDIPAALATPSAIVPRA